jgi:hypothetical protein
MIQCNPKTYYYLPLPLTFNADGGATLVMRKGEIVDNIFTPIDSMMFEISPSDLSKVLDAQPEAGMTRRDDLVKQIYQYVLATGKIEGSII